MIRRVKKNKLRLKNQYDNILKKVGADSFTDVENLTNERLDKIYQS